MSLELSAPQDIFLNKLNTKYRAYVGGYGSGKTAVGCFDLAIFASRNPGLKQGYFGATYMQIRDIFYPTFEEMSYLLGFKCDIKTTDKEVHLYRNGAYYGVIICRSMDNPSSIVGFKIAHALVDEIDLLPKDKATLAWRKIIARMRLVVDGQMNSVGVTTTPEGFKFIYETFKKDPKCSYSMVQATSYENEQYLPDDYIASLYETYPAEVARAYVGGEFVNLTAGTVYYGFNRAIHWSIDEVRGDEPIMIGMDFNVNQMAASIAVWRNNELHYVDEFSKIKDTPAMIDAIKQRYPNNHVVVYPDASGDNKSSKDASVSDINLLKQAGFRIRVSNKNPMVKDRILAANIGFEKGRIFVNTKKCPEITLCLEQQAYDKNGMPDKTGHDHQNDATTYLINHEMPVLKRGWK